MIKKLTVKEREIPLAGQKLNREWELKQRVRWEAVALGFMMPAMRWLRLWRGWLPFVLLAGCLAFSNAKHPWEVTLLLISVLSLVGFFIFYCVEDLMQHHDRVRRSWQSWEKNMPPKCSVCGYDLRASKERCPECGTTIPLTPLPQSPMVKRSIGHAAAVARDMGADHVGTEHLLLALFSEPESAAAFLLANLGVEENAVRCRIPIADGEQIATK